MDIPGFVRSLPAFARLGQQELGALCAAFMVESHPAGHAFIREGDRADAVYLLFEGEVGVGRELTGGWKEISRLRSGDLFGLIALVDSGLRSASCRAETAVVVGSMPRNVFTFVFNAHAPVGLAFQDALCNQLARDFRRLDNRIQRALSGTLRDESFLA